MPGMDGYTHKYPLRDIKDTLAFMLPKAAPTEERKERKLLNAFLKNLKTVDQLR